ncbi:Lrp/AsnC family transcriptional regulator [Xenophilus sp. Marseille-Q4582]|uniref:Lrp/AsnC family transcriptional regulator n=1 Tax=Xenophilus sp. Marseille-Q4582 TaxID=2866600 RepID=UPI001CE4B1D1|nr:Lrp/AsnC family transcriptional regulator [Xenophilus sp. Marseille-Q4582]
MESLSLDAIDWRLLDALQRDASRTNQQLAQDCHLSPPTCLRRVQRLRALGLVEQQVAVLSAERLGTALLTALAEVVLDRQDAESLQAFEIRACADEAVQQCYRVSPGPDFMLVVTVRDMPAYHALVQRLFTADANVRNVKAFFSVRRAKFQTLLPLPRADGA